MTIEKRFFPGGAEVRAEGDGSTHITGMGAVFSTWSPVYGGAMFGFRERLDPGFFDLAMDDPDINGLFNHDVNVVLGRTGAGTMTLAKRTEGLFYDISAPKTQMVRDMVIEPIGRGDVKGSSFSFELMDEETDGEPGDKWERGADGVWERTLLRAKRIFDLGPVTRPWYPTTDTSVAQRSLDAYRKRTDAGAAVVEPPVEEVVSTAEEVDEAIAAGAAVVAVVEEQPAEPVAVVEPEPVAEYDPDSDPDLLALKLAGAA